MHKIIFFIKNFKRKIKFLSFFFFTALCKISFRDCMLCVCVAVLVSVSTNSVCGNPDPTGMVLRGDGALVSKAFMGSVSSKIPVSLLCSLHPGGDSSPPMVAL